MNQLTVILIQIEHVESLHHLTFSLGKQTIQVLSLELASNLKVGSRVKLSVKSTDIALAKNFTGQLSYANQLKAKITHVNNGKLLSSIGLDVKGLALESVITLNASLAMALQEGDDVVVLVKGSEVSVCA
ncbi:TOBE domain-containing protein [bacterium]|nr:TOBE domain-containing protein [bacterium]MBU1958026.1 TOBE domain-containing protein [bacterium]